MSLVSLFKGRAKEGAVAAVAAVVIAVNIIFFLFVVRPQDERITELDAVARGEGSLGAAIEDLKVFKRRMPAASELTTVINEVFKAASASGLKIPGGDYSPDTVRNGDVASYTISFPVKGGYPEVKKFLYSIEAMNRPVAVEDVALSRGARGGGRDIELKIKLTVYFREK